MPCGVSLIIVSVALCVAVMILVLIDNPQITYGNPTANADIAFGADLPQIAIPATHSSLKVFDSISLPHKLDLRDGPCAPYPPPWNQKSFGTCTAMAVGGAFVCGMRRKHLDTNVMPSILYNYYWSRQLNNEGKLDSGVMLNSALQAARDNGLCADGLFPYSMGIAATPPPKAEHDSLYRSVMQFTEISRTLDNLKRCLAHGYPFVFSFLIRTTADKWFKNKDDQLSTLFHLPEGNSDDANVGAHAVVAIGYDDAELSFLIRNSWGEEWGIGGHFWMAYDILVNPNIVPQIFVVDDVCLSGTSAYPCITKCPKNYSSAACRIAYQ